MLKVRNLKKKYKDVNALKGISFDVEKGEIFGFLGPNGAGKTTAISILSTLLDADSGEVYYQDKDIFKNFMWWRKKIGIVPQEMAFYQELTAKENIMLWASLYGMGKKEAKRRSDELLETMGLTSKMKAKVSEFSGGMKRRLNISLGVVHKPEFIFLDEPTVGIDVQAKVKIKEILKDFSEQGITMIYTTHQMEEAEELCDRIGIIDEGEIKAMGTLKQLISQLGEKDSVEFNGDFEKPKILNIVDSTNKVNLLKYGDDKIMLEIDEEHMIPELVKKFIKSDIHIKSMDIKRPNLETLFIKLTGKELRE